LVRRAKAIRRLPEASHRVRRFPNRHDEALFDHAMPAESRREITKMSRISPKRIILLCALSGVLAALALAACGGSRNEPTDEVTGQASEATVSTPGLTSTNLQLAVPANACDANGAQEYFEITNVLPAVSGGLMSSGIAAPGQLARPVRSEQLQRANFRREHRRVLSLN
jgi:hypothetical protein